ncbi:hypothetical protein FFK22_008920 [Mycobacterium sp. KBS0706]|uniref:hypothetical protein n=1 Tax=Mycobacterium sp. KBS0706 TaxID=2578109 RepID=UPI00110FEE1F|nr:hypothetical protein [Mycobacterium sp. KBS0706]TSD89092.1 hypothetical protein FFK22_008920 [Mycobacterium sp. KBS0706]
MMRVFVIVTACAAGVLLPTGAQPMLHGDWIAGAPALALGLACCAAAMLGDRRLQRSAAPPRPASRIAFGRRP